MRASLLFSAVLSVFTAASASGAVVAGWTFETSMPTTAGGHAPEIGSGKAYAFHAAAGVTYSSPDGNGSNHSFSSDSWHAEAYYEFIVDTSPYVVSPGHYLQISWEQTRNHDGPLEFKLAYSTDGSTYYGAAGFTVDEIPWSASSYTPGSSRSWDASAVPGGLLGESSVYIRFIGNSTGASPAGTFTLDDVYISVVPEPHEYAAMAGLGLLGFAVWRRSRQA